MNRASGGRGGLVGVEGPAGIGKSILLAHVREKATSAGWRVLDTRCTPMSTTISNCLLRDWFGTLAHRIGSGIHPFDGPGQVLADLTDGSGRGIGDLAYGVRWVLEDLTTDQPVLLVVDDLQWADAGSLQVLDLLVNALGQLPCLVVYAVRTGERVSSPESLGRIQQASKILTPAPLSLAAVASLMQEMNPSVTDADVEEVHRSTGGVPFYVQEVVAEGGETTPEAVIGSIAGRLPRVSDTAAETARAIFVLGSQASIGTVSALTGEQLDVVADDIAALVAAQVVSLENGQLAARHPLIAQAVLAHMTSAESAELHRRTAELLASRGAARAVVANHLLHTVPAGDPRVQARLREQGEHALGGGSYDMAIRYLDRALAESVIGEEQIQMLSALARAHAASGDLDEALATWERASGLTDDVDVLAGLRAEAGDALVMAGRLREAQATFGSVGDPASATGPAQQRLVARMVMAGLVTGVSVGQLRTQVERVLAQPEEQDSHEDRLSLAAGSMLLAFEGQDAGSAKEMALRAAGGGLLLQEEGSEGTALYMATASLTWTSSVEVSEALLTAAIEEAQARGSGTAFASASGCRGYARVRMGKITEAILDLEAALEQRAQGWNTYLALVLASLVECRIARGELHAALAYENDLSALTQEPGLAGAYATSALADLADARGDHELAATLFAEVGRLVSGRMDNPAILPWRAGQSLAMIRLGQHKDAIPLARQNLDAARSFGAPYAIAQALRTLATVDPTSDRLGQLRLALDTLRGTRAVRLEAQIATDLAGMQVLLGGAGSGEEAVTLLRKAEAQAGFQELRPLSDRVRRLLERVGEPVHRSTSEAVNTLTVSERRVADLAASGMSNRQIAQQLFVTVKAVEWHLSNVYRKLGIRSRTRLPAVLAVPGPRSPADDEPDRAAQERRART